MPTNEQVRRTWVKSPQAGGRKIPEAVKQRTVQRILNHAEKHYKGRYSRLDIRFRGQFCYIDAYREHVPTHLCRLRYFSENEWSLAFYTYSNEQYEACLFGSNKWLGTPEEGLDVGAVYLDE
jgi:hypothetical protein